MKIDYVVCQRLDGVVSIWIVGLTGTAKVERDAIEVLGELRHLEGVTGVIGGKEGNEDHGLAGTLPVVVHSEFRFNLRHVFPRRVSWQDRGSFWTGILCHRK